MKPQHLLSKSSLLALTVGAVSFAASSHANAEPQIIELTQVPCQFLDVEKDHGYTSAKKADCETINEASGGERLANSKTMKLKPGDYIFRVKNENVPYELGFWLREKDYNWANPLHKLNKISVSGGGLHEGLTKDYKVTLKEGEYLFSCPLNTTLDYNLIVEKG